MIGKSYFLLALLQAVVSGEWRGDTPRDVTAQKGLCARIPCHYSYPSSLANESRDGVWFNSEKVKPWAPLAFHSKDSKHTLPRFRHRTRLSGNLKDGDCSLVMNDVTQEDEGPYFFRIEFNHQQIYSFFPVTQIHVSDFTDKPSIFPAEMVAGKPVNVHCTFNTTCDGTVPTLTWVTPTDVPSSVSDSTTQRGDTLIYTSVLTLTPELKHHGENLTCRVRYPSVSSERTLTLTVQYKPEISPKSGCTQMPEGITCVCTARSNPPAELTWHLPLANLSGNQTHGRFQAWQVADGQLVTGSLTLRGGEGEEETTASCTVRNQHGEVTFKMYLWVRGGCDRIEKRVIAGITIGALVIAGMVITITRTLRAKCCHSKRENALAQPKVQKAEGEVVDVESLYQELRAGNRDLYSELKPSYN
ncbi:myelin-associated glycoprotein-like [Pristis pectinata]|uniref:myelin-associated glycoprotein-like n=1 Tax=Pristis pectinata TaxID=685728 RepID=UPI00223DF120|nr:myelin-associated glycoprotein-like [Pristis pectinata]